MKMALSSDSSGRIGSLKEVQIKLWRCDSPIKHLGASKSLRKRARIVQLPHQNSGSRKSTSRLQNPVQLSTCEGEDTEFQQVFIKQEIVDDSDDCSQESNGTTQDRNEINGMTVSKHHTAVVNNTSGVNKVQRLGRCVENDPPGKTNGGSPRPVFPCGDFCVCGECESESDDECMELSNEIVLKRIDDNVNKQPPHTANKRGGDDKPHNCHCGKKFKRLGDLKVHQFAVHGNERPYKCKKCPRTFARRNALNFHQNVHESNRPFVCDVCGNSFKQNGNMKRHKEIAHEGLKLFKCNCGKSFSQAHHLSRHQTVHTGERNHNCSHCSKAFGQLSDLQKHMRIHTGEKPYSCTVCQKSFALSGNLKQHMAVHSRRSAPFNCDLCDKSFRSKKYLKRHRLHCQTGGRLFRQSCKRCDCFFTRDEMRNHVCIVQPACGNSDSLGSTPRLQNTVDIPISSREGENIELERVVIKQVMDDNDDFVEEGNGTPLHESDEITQEDTFHDGTVSGTPLPFGEPDTQTQDVTADDSNFSAPHEEATRQNEADGGIQQDFISAFSERCSEVPNGGESIYFMHDHNYHSYIKQEPYWN